MKQAWDGFPTYSAGDANRFLKKSQILGFLPSAGKLFWVYFALLNDFPSLYSISCLTFLPSWPLKSIEGFPR